MNSHQQLCITVTGSNQAPVLDAIGDETRAENAAITPIDAADGGDDNDVDGTALTYSCRYDNVEDADTSGGTDCTTLAGFNLNTTTGQITWTPDYSAATGAVHC